MKKNMGSTDKLVRVIIAVIIAALYFTNTITGTLGIVLLVLAGVFVLTSVISFSLRNHPLKKPLPEYPGRLFNFFSGMALFSVFRRYF
jgi:hypothetical protein